MYKVQNTMPGNLPIDLEKGSIILTSGQMFDLDEHCSRKWIMSNALLKRLLASSALRLVHDSEVVIASAPIKKVVAVAPKQTSNLPIPQPVTHVAVKKVKKAKKTKTIDLSSKAEPTEKEYKKPRATTRKKKEEKDPVEKALEEKDPVEKSLKETSSKKTYSYKKQDDETEDKPKKRTYTRRKKEEKEDED